MFRVLTESAIEFQNRHTNSSKRFFSFFSVLENLTEKHSFADDHVL